MKKLLIVPAIIGLLAVPSLAMAQHGADNTNQNDTSSVDGMTVKPITSIITNTSTTTTENNEALETEHKAQPAVSPVATITVDEATATALKLFPDKTVKGTETETEHGVLVIEVKFTDGSEVVVNAETGAVVSSKDEGKETEDKDKTGDLNSNNHQGSDNSGSGHQGSDN